MGPDLASVVHDWRDFSGLVGNASATLAALVLTAASVGASVFNEKQAGADEGVFAACLSAFLLGALDLHPDANANANVAFAQHRARLPGCGRRCLLRAAVDPGFRDARIPDRSGRSHVLG